ncbi:uncharacterized protein EDB93DRAFT_298316 [Suillus bovinus]|uniref:uncharacterized protein n=1 Tax=Suillus bovinus TaxID=48563 RepID=UPI001B86A2F5|nr:uncharacterized protein EDB93DRAFT_298316 [Suillus bovinus]KAG2151167.1 hypothetical protein EDB93DRAFT_298316 [Suillus bovinus]
MPQQLGIDTRGILGDHQIASGGRSNHHQLPPLRTVLLDPSNHFADIIERLQRRRNSLLFHLRTGHAPLTKHLRRITKSATATCSQCEESNESVHYFLFICPAYTRQPNTLHAELHTKAHHMKHLLDEPACSTHLFKYVATSRRFEMVFSATFPAHSEGPAKNIVHEDSEMVFGDSVQGEGPAKKLTETPKRTHCTHYPFHLQLVSMSALQPRTMERDPSSKTTKNVHTVYNMYRLTQGVAPTDNKQGSKKQLVWNLLHLVCKITTR